MGLIDDIFADVRRNFIYRPDDDQFGREDWRSHADEIDKPWWDDCDGFALTCADLAVESGIAKDQVRIARCLSEVGQRQSDPPPYDHLVCLIDTDDGLMPPGHTGTLALDCRQRRVEPWDRLGYRWHSSRRLSQGMTWRDMTGAAPIEIAQPVAPPLPAT